MKIEVRKSAQFPNGVIDLSGLNGGETIMMDSRLGQKIWLKGKATGPEPLFGTMQIHVGQGPDGFGFEIASSAGDAPLIVQTANAHDFEAIHASVYELTEEGVKNVRERL